MAPGAGVKFEVDTEEFEFLRHGTRALRARLYRPKGAGPFPAMVDGHGGAWIQGSFANNDPINRPLAEGGIVVLSVDYRLPPEGTYPSSVADMNYAIRWLKLNAERIGSRPERVGAMGTSSGGHLAVLASMKPDEPRYAAIPLAGGEALDATVACVVAMWPVICPLSRYRDNLRRMARGEAHHPGRVGAGADQMRYWLTEEAMGEGSPLMALARGDGVRTPDLLYVQAACDTLHPRASMDEFLRRYRERGGRAELELVGGEPYDLVRARPDSPGARQAIARIVAFVRERRPAGSAQDARASAAH
jgi:acetyl esterase/lipase